MVDVNPINGFSAATGIYHSLRPPISFPPSSAPFSVPDYVFSVLPSAPASASAAALISAADRRRIHLSDLPALVRALASNLRRKFRLDKNEVAFVLSPNSVDLPVLYFALLSIGIVVSPSNPISSDSDISRQVRLSKPVIAFATAGTASRVPSLREGTVVLDSPEFESLLIPLTPKEELVRVEVFQNDTAAILYSSGTTGRVKGVELTHRNFIAAVAGVRVIRPPRSSAAVTLCTVPFFHMYGFLLCIREVALGGSLLLPAGRGLEPILKAVQEYNVTHIAAVPPIVTAMVKNPAVKNHDCRCLEAVLCGGAPLPNSVIEKFKEKFPSISLVQAYGLTETTSGITRALGAGESEVIGSNGRLMSNCQAKIVDPVTCESLPPLKPGEIWIRGPMVMKGYVGDKEATAAMIDSEGWLKTGDIGYFNNEGHLFYVERMKELIKYKGYQVAPAELEDVLVSHPGIVDAAVIPYPDEDAGQLPVAFVVKQPGYTVNDSDIMDFVAQKVAPYKRIRRVFYINSIPKNAPGKTLRKELIKIALGTSSKL